MERSSGPGATIRDCFGTVVIGLAVPRTCENVVAMMSLEIDLCPRKVWLRTSDGASHRPAVTKNLVK
jgi:hypothetical protein